MGISIFCTVTSPTMRGDDVEDALLCYSDLADEVVVIDGSFQMDNPDKKWMEKLGGYENIDTEDEEWVEPRIDKRIINEWPKEFSWEFIGQQFQRGYEACTGDWVIHCDLDYLFHEQDFEATKLALGAHPQEPALSFWKYQFVLPDRYNLKSRLPLAVNKKVFGARIKFDSGGDLCQPSLDGKQIDVNKIPEVRVPIYNYEKLIKTKPQIADDQGRMERAWFRKFGEYQMSADGTDKSAYKAWYRMQQGRFNKPSEQIKLSEHPKYIQETIKNLKPENFGYNGFGLIEGKVYA